MTVDPVLRQLLRVISIVALLLVVLVLVLQADRRGKARDAADRACVERAATPAAILRCGHR